ncbi:MAG: sialate O-acetylesterase [Verrucomicrobiia bacterium]
MALLKYAGGGTSMDHPQAEIVVRALLWHQGEADVGSAAIRYKANMQRFIRDLREDLNAPDRRAERPSAGTFGGKKSLNYYNIPPTP